LTMVYLMLGVEGSCVIFSIRCEGSLLASSPSLRFGAAIVGGEIAAVLIAVYGAAMTAIGWEIAGVQLLYMFVCLLVFDFLKQVYEKMEAYYYGEHELNKTESSKDKATTEKLEKTTMSPASNSSNANTNAAALPCASPPAAAPAPAVATSSSSSSASRV